LLALLTIVTLAVSNSRIQRESDAKVDALARAESNALAAQRNSEIAQDNYGMAKTAVEEFLEGILDDPQLNSRGELQELRKQLLSRLIPFYDALAKRKNDDAAMESERGLAYMKLSMLKAEMGDSPSAIKDSLTAAAIFEQQAKAFPDDPMYRLVLVDCHKNLGKTLAENGRLQEALEETGKAIHLVEGLREVFRDPADGLQELSRLHFNRSHMLASLGQWHESLAACEQSITYQELVLPMMANAPEARFILSNGHNHRGRLLSELHRDEESLAAFEKAAIILRTLTEELPDNRDYRFVLATIHNNVGILHTKANAIEQSRQAYDRALEILVPLSDAFPSVVAYQQCRMSTLVNRGQALRQGENYELAMQSVQDAVQIADHLLNRSSSPELRLDAGLAYALQAKVATDREQVDLAKAMADKSLQILQELTNDFPDNAYLASQLNQVQRELARLPEE
jgi:tetratricopeptide (TPR) repeat protein